VQRILFLIPDLDYRGASHQLVLLAAGLRCTPFDPHVCVLGPGGPLVAPLRASGVAVTVLGHKRLFDVKPWLGLRQLFDTIQPDVIHAWQPAALRAAALAMPRGSRLVASAVVDRPRRGTLLGGLDRQLLRYARWVHVTGPAEAERARRLGLADGELVQIPPGVAARDCPEACPAGISVPGVPDGARCVLCVGPIEPHRGHQDAIWTMDILKYLYEDLHLLVAGAGADRERLEGFVRDIRAGGHVHFLGPQADMGGWYARSEVVWVPNQKGGGENTALEAMAAARPVVASRLPGLAEIVRDGETGFLAPPSDKVALARQTRLLLDDPALRHRIGEAGRRHALGSFAAATMVDHFARLYSSGSP
jgi:glycosyltransferase involved in cell wall biosynthesis